MKIHPLLLAAVLATGGVAFAQTAPATPAPAPASAKSAAPVAPHKAAMHKMSMHRHAHATAAASPAAGPMTTRDERMAAAEADYKASLEKKSDRPAAAQRMQRHHAGHAMRKHQPAKAAPAA